MAARRRAVPARPAAPPPPLPSVARRAVAAAADAYGLSRTSSKREQARLAFINTLRRSTPGDPALRRAILLRDILGPPVALR